MSIEGDALPHGELAYDGTPRPLKWSVSQRFQQRLRRDEPDGGRDFPQHFKTRLRIFYAAGYAEPDTGFVVALLSSQDTYHNWAVAQASEMPPPWSTCEAVLSEALHLLGERGAPNLGALLRRRALVVAFTLAENVEAIVKLIEKYSNVPMGFADACLVRMTEILTDPIILTTDQDFRVYRRHSRQVVPCATPE